MTCLSLSGVANNVMNAARRLPQVPEATTNGGFFSKFFGKKDQHQHPQVSFQHLIDTIFCKMKIFPVVLWGFNVCTGKDSHKFL